MTRRVTMKTICCCLVVFTLVVLYACGSEGFMPRSASHERGVDFRGLGDESAGVGMRGAEVGGFYYGAAEKRSTEQPDAGLVDLPALRPGEELWLISRGRVREAVDAGPQEKPDDPGTGCLRCQDPDSGDLVPLPLDHTEVKGRITAYVASVDVTQVFRNPFDQKIEVEYVFPLPQDSAVNGFVMVIGDRRIRGIIREREEAERIYTAARAMGHVASLLTQERPNIFTQRVANIEPGKRIDVNITYHNTLRYSDGWYSFVFPMVVGPRFNPPRTANGVGAVSRTAQGTSGQPTEVTYLEPGKRSGHDIALALDIDAGVKLEDLRCTTHETLIRRDSPNQAHVQLSKKDSIPNKDFVLHYKVAGQHMKSGLMVHKTEQGGWFSLMLYPPLDLQKLERQPLELIFVVDCSGSMSGQPLAQAKDAMLEALGHVGPRDSLQLIRFSNSSSQFGSRPVPASHENISRAKSWVRGLTASGGTHMLRGIEAALEFPHDPDRLRFVCFMTDGFIGNEGAILGAIHEKLGQSRIFSFGVGSSPNRYLMHRMARLGRGVVSFLGTDDDGRVVMKSFLNRISHPGLCHLSLEWNGADVGEVFPVRLPDLFAGRPVAITGRFKGELPASIGVEGSAGGSKLALQIPVSMEESRSHPALASVWARMKIADLNDAMAYAPRGRAELAEAIKATALEYGLMSAFTAFVAVDSMTKTEGGEGPTVPVAVPVPKGVKYSTTVETER